MAAIALGVAIASTAAPGPFLRLFGLGSEQLSPAALLAWRLVAARNLAISVRALRGDTSARDLFLPVQALDQLAWWQLFGSGRLSLRATAMAASASGAIVALDLRRRLRFR